MKLTSATRRLTSRLFKAEPLWLKEIKRCQDEILSFDPHPHYVSAYREEETHYWHHIPKWIHEDSRKTPIRRCLDIGCAYGTLALFCRRLLRCEVYCTDFMDTYIRQSLIHKYHLLFALNNIELDPFPWQGQYDIIIFTEVLEHLNFHPLPTLKKIGNLLSENGRLYLSTPDASSWGKVTKYYRTFDQMPLPGQGPPVIDDHIYVFTKDELLCLVEEAGFNVQRLDYSQIRTSRNFNLTLTRKR